MSLLPNAAGAAPGDATVDLGSALVSSDVEVAQAATEMELATPVVEDSFVPYTETIFESLEAQTAVREEAVSEEVEERFGGRLARVFRGLQEVRSMLREGDFLGAAMRLARVAYVSRQDVSSLSRFREARSLLQFAASAQRDLAEGDVDGAVLNLERGMGEVAAAAQERMAPDRARALVRALANIRAAANRQDYDEAMELAQSLIGRFGSGELDRAFQDVVFALRGIEQVVALRKIGLTHASFAIHGSHGFVNVLESLNGSSRLSLSQVAAPSSRELDEQQAPGESADPRRNPPRSPRLLAADP